MINHNKNFAPVHFCPVHHSDGKKSADPILFFFDDIYLKLGIHPLALVEPNRLTHDEYEALTVNYDYENAAEWWLECVQQRLVELSDNGQVAIHICFSYADLHCYSDLIGAQLQPEELNPYLGMRGVSRFVSQSYKSVFELECEAIKRFMISTSNSLNVYIPYIRTCSESATAIDILAEQGLYRGVNGLKVHLLASLPANLLCADKLLHYFDGYVVDIKSLYQLTLGFDASNKQLHYSFDGRNEALHELLESVRSQTDKVNKPCAIFFRGLDEYPQFSRWLLENNIENIWT
ncbi:TPA: putative PEP-binding protein [Photobacterium damselae]